MKNARPQNSETSAAYTAYCTNKMTRATIVISRIMAVVHPDYVLLAALLCLLLWGCA